MALIPISLDKFSSPASVCVLPKPKERWTIAQYADKAKNTIFLTPVVGVIRMVSSLVLYIFATIASIFIHILSDKNRTNDQELIKDCRFFRLRCKDEFQRGFFELVPYLINVLDNLRGDEENRREISGGSCTNPNGVAYGKYMYEIEWKNRTFICYSNEEYTGSVSLIEAQGMLGGTAGIEGRIQDINVDKEFLSNNDDKNWLFRIFNAPPNCHITIRDLPQNFDNL